MAERQASATVPVRLGKVGRQFATAAAAAAVYYLATTWLLDRFGQRGFLYALFALAAGLAFLREFGPDLKGLPGRVRESLQQRREAKARSRPPNDAPVPEDEEAAAPPLPEIVTRAEAEALFREQVELRDAGGLSEEDFGASVARFHFIDQHGKFWTMQPDTGSWAFFKQGAWNPGLPLGSLSRAKTPGA